MSSDGRARRRGAGPPLEPIALELELENIALRSELAALVSAIEEQPTGVIRSLSKAVLLAMDRARVTLGHRGGAKAPVGD